jgi:hypothetical protein
VSGDSLIVHVEGADKLWAMKSQLQIPLANVVSAARASEEAHSWLHGDVRRPVPSAAATA